jgi:hypothetical protein
LIPDVTSIAGDVTSAGVLYRLFETSVAHPWSLAGQWDLSSRVLLPPLVTLVMQRGRTRDHGTAVTVP